MRKKNFIKPLVLFLALLILALAYANDGTAGVARNKGGTIKLETTFKLRSLSFDNFQAIPERYSYNMRPQCSGGNYSPALSWEGVPAGTKSLAVIMHDPDGGNWTHWVQFNIPPSVARLDEAKGGPAVGIKGSNSFGGTGYAGPCPPSDSITHRYVFILYALDSVINLPSGTTREHLEKAMEDHVLGKAMLTGLKKRD
jgi:Raf kinase inhibitor-like YbhB/YbcL family protein